MPSIGYSSYIRSQRGSGRVRLARRFTRGVVLAATTGGQANLREGGRRYLHVCGQLISPSCARVGDVSVRIEVPSTGALGSIAGPEGGGGVGFCGGERTTRRAVAEAHSRAERARAYRCVAGSNPRAGHHADGNRPAGGQRGCRTSVTSVARIDAVRLRVRAGSPRRGLVIATRTTPTKRRRRRRQGVARSSRGCAARP